MRFDETKGFKFISYAVWWIRQSIIQALGEQGRIVRLPSNRVNLGNQVQRAYSKLEQVQERAPSVEELATELNICEEEILSLGDYNFSYVSLDTPISATSEESMSDTMVDEKTGSADKKVTDQLSLQLEVERCLQSLTKRENNIVRCFFGIGLPEPISLQEIADHYNMSKERVRQIKDKALNHLRAPNKVALLRKYLGS
jgi:RNA polymerase primary sigma factor